VPSGITSVERRAVVEAATTAGAKQVYLIDEPMAAAIGAGLAVSDPVCSMVVDIGGGTTEVAVISLGGIVAARSVRIAGDAIDAAIMAYVRREHALLIGERTAEAVKLAIGSAAPAGYWPERLGVLDRDFEEPQREDAVRQWPDAEERPDTEPGPDPASPADDERDPVAATNVVTAVGSREGAGRCRIRGRDQVTGLPKTLELDADQVRHAIDDPVDGIIDAVRQTLDACPPEAAGDIVERGMVLTGGGALLPGLDVRLSSAFDIPVVVADSPLDCVVVGTGRCVENYDALRTVLDATPDTYLAYKA
jgi:rod shape-determining protein MreB